MLSKQRKFLFVLGSAVLAFSTMSCSYFFGDKDDKSNTYNLSLNEKTSVSCVKDNSALLRDYFDMERDDAQMAQDLRAMKKCLRDAVDLFVRHTRSSDENGDNYTPKDIHEFLSSAFDTYTYGPVFMDDVIRLKDSLIGGTPFQVTKAEVRLLNVYIDYVYDALAELATERHYIFNNDPADTWDKFPAAADKFMTVVKKFQSLPRKNSGQFDYNNLVKVAKYFLDDDVDMDHWDKTFRLVNSLQALVVSGQPGSVQIARLPFAVNQLASLYLSYVEFEKYLKDEVLFKDMAAILIFPALVRNAVEHPEALDGNRPLILNSIQAKILATMELSTQNAPGGELSMNYLDHAIETLKVNGSLPDYLKAETIKNLIPRFFSTWLVRDPCEGAACEARVVKAEHIVTLRNLLNQWKTRQVWINAQPRASVTRNQFLSAVTRGRDDAVVGPFIKALEQVNHLHWDKYLVVGDKQVTFRDMIVFHNIYTLAQLFTRPFNGNEAKPQLVDYFLDKSQAAVFYSWFHPLGLELKLVDPRSLVTSIAAFTEINLFGSTAEKPDEMNFSEMIEYFEISISTSFRAVDLITYEFQDSFTQTCRVPGVYDVFGYQKIYSECFRNVWLEKHEQFLFNSMPKLSAYLATLDDDSYLTILNLLERAARQGVIVDEHFDTDALRQLSSIMQYAESLFGRFDRNENNLIESDEMRAALAHLIPNISGILETAVDPAFAAQLYKFFPNFEEDLITYILAKKELPELLTSETLGGAATSAIKVFKIWSNSKADWLNGNPDVKRSDVLLVISGLSSMSRVTKVKNLKKHFFDQELEFQKPLSGPTDPLLAPLAKELLCAAHVRDDLLVWLYDNKVRYWDEVLDWVKPEQFVLFGWDVSSLGISTNDIPGINDINFQFPWEDGAKVNLANAVNGWEKDVTYKLIELLTKEPVLGSLCTVPFVTYEGNRMARQQDYKQTICTGGGSVMGMPTPMHCETYRRTPY